MEPRPSFKFKESDVFTADEVSELYKLFKVIDERNDGQISQKEISKFIEDMYGRDGVDYTADDINWVHARLSEFYDKSKDNLVDFDNFLTVVENWFIYTGAVKFTSDNNMRELTAMTEDTCRGFHQIVKAMFYENQFQIASELIEGGKEVYQDIENSILDMNTKGKFVLASMNDKSEALERSKELYLTFSEVLNEFSPNTSIDHINTGLNHILAIFDVLDNIVIDFELNMIKPHIHSIFGWIINTNMFDKFVEILSLGETVDVSVAKISTLQILCHLSRGIGYFNPDEGTFPLITNEGYYAILCNKLNHPELLIRIRDCIDSSWVEVVEQACITIGYFVKNNLDIGKELIEYGIINSLVQIINVSQVEPINEAALWCIFNICRKYLPDSEKITKDRDEDPIYKIAFKSGELMYEIPTTARSSYCYMILTCGYTLRHLTQYYNEVKYLCDKIIELLDVDDVMLTKWCLITMTKWVKKDAAFLTHFNNPLVFQILQKSLLTPGDKGQVQYALSYLYEISLEHLLAFDTNVINSLSYVHGSESRNSKDVLKIFTSVIKTAGSKHLIKQNKDFFKFVFEAVEEFKSESDNIIQTEYHQEKITIDIVYLLSCLELMYCLCTDSTQETCVSNISAEKVNKLEPVVGFFFDWFQQWESERRSVFGSTSRSDKVLEECANILLGKSTFPFIRFCQAKR